MRGLHPKGWSGCSREPRSSGTARMGGGPVLCLQCLGDLHGVERRALQQLIARDEKRDRAAGGVARVLADAANEDRVLTGGILRHRKIIALGIIDQSYPWSCAHELAHLG